MTSHIEWFDELSLEPDAHPVTMGTRALGDRRWLVVDERRNAELALKAQLLSVQHGDVTYLTDESREAATALISLIEAESKALIAPGEEHPLERAAMAVQEDLCLLRRHNDGWHLDASVLCFPTRWRLHDKVDQHIARVHGPVEDYDSRVRDRVDRLFDQLTGKPVWRRNWFLMTDTTLHQPVRPERETIVGRDAVRSDVYLRSERQTLRRLTTDWSLFTIRIQQESLGDLLTSAERAQSFTHWVEHVSPNFGLRRHLTEPQRTELLAGLS